MWEEEIYICALRYALNRRTYITGVVSDFLIEKADSLSERSKSVMIRDIERAEKKDELGDQRDKDSWMKLLDKLKE